MPLRARFPERLVIACIVIVLGFASNVAAQTAAAPPYAAEPDHIEVMFAAESQVRLRAGSLVDLATNALDGVDAELRAVTRYEWSRIADVPEQTIDEWESRGKANGVDVYNLNNIYRLRFEGNVDVWTLSARLEALPGVMLARPVPKPMELPLPPNYQPSQNYEDPASAVPTGVDAEYAWTQPFGNGSMITVCDLEYSWNYNHNDVTGLVGSQINSNVADPFSDTNHGTAVAGEMLSLDNGWGTKGVNYGGSIRTCGTYYGFPTPSWNVPGAIAVAIANLNQGDIILLEQQWDYTGGGGYVPVEWWTNTTPNPQTNNAVFAAIVNAIGVGIHVVEAGGNGNVNTGAMTWFGDSGAIIVGAGGAYPGGSWPQGNLERLSFSSYGPRFNLQGWGENVYTTGYGNLFSAEGVNRYYTHTFSGTSSASPIVAGAAACVQAFYVSNISPTPIAPTTMRTLLMNTGTPQFFGLAGNIGPRPDCLAAIQSLSPAQFAEYGDAPEGAPAYPWMGVFGSFPTCVGSGPPGSFVRHGIPGGPVAFFGPNVDYEMEGNAGNCPIFPPYDADECQYDSDAGLIAPTAYTIDPGFNVALCSPGPISSLGLTCGLAVWGTNIDIQVNNQTPQWMYVNALFDWDQDGRWSSSSQCPSGPVDEYAVVNVGVPPGYSGPLSALAPPSFTIGPNAGYVWSRFTIAEILMPPNWDGSATFNNGETEDYLLRIDPGQAHAEYGDAPENAIAYPWSGVFGQFPTCVGSGPSGFVRHNLIATMWLGPSVDVELEGNAGNCPNFPPYDADECQNDGDAGLMYPIAWTIDAGLNLVTCPNASGPVSLGSACSGAAWGLNIDVAVNNSTPQDVYINVLMDWDQSGAWGGTSTCPNGGAPEHVLVNFVVPASYFGPLSALSPPGFLIGPNDRWVWSRFTISESPVPANWDGSGSFQYGETSDYLLQLDPQVQQSLEYGDAPENAIAYPWSGVIGAFPTCVGSGPSGFVSHSVVGAMYFGPSVDIEPEGNAGNCPNFPPYDADECWNDGDAGLMFPPPYTIDPGLNVVPCDPTQQGSLGLTCNQAAWGPNVDIMVNNPSVQLAFVNVLMDWDQNGSWGGSSPCPLGAAPENVLVNFQVPAGFSGPLSALAPPGFLIGPNDRFVWCRFTISEAPVPIAWDGSALFNEGETCDYLLRVDAQPQQGFEFGDAPENALAYPWSGVIGQFPTCVAAGPAGFVSHVPSSLLYFGPSIDFEVEGNAGNCPNFPPYDADECQNDGDAGLLTPIAYTISGPNIVTCPNPTGSGVLGSACSIAFWGPSIDIQVVNSAPFDAYVNVLIDWNQNGVWAAGIACPQGGGTPEHVLINFVVPAGFNGPLSALAPPSFLIGPNDRYVWSRFTISESPLPVAWNGTGSFQYGETCDFLLAVSPSLIGIDDQSNAITATRLLPAVPNPFHGMTTVQFEMADAGPVTVGVYDVAGRRIRSLVEGERAVGRYEVIWNGRNDAGEQVSAGMYFVRLRAGAKTFTKPLVLLK